MNKHLLSLFSLALLFAIFPSVALAATWTGPSASAPNGNTPPPINVDLSNQYKQGGLSLGSTDTNNLTSSINLFSPYAKFFTIFAQALNLSGGSTDITPLTVQARRAGNIYVKIENLTATDAGYRNPYALFADNFGGFGVSQLGVGNRLTVDRNGIFTVDSLKGSGNRMVVANAAGALSAQAIPSGSAGLPNGTTLGQLLVWDSSANKWVLAPDVECDKNDILKWNGDMWSCGRSTTSSGSVGYDGDGTSITRSSTLSNGSYIFAARTGDAIWNANKLQGTSVSVGATRPSTGQVIKYLRGTGAQSTDFWVVGNDNDTLGQVSCGAGTGYLYWDGSAWLCKAVSTGSTYTAGAGINISGTTISNSSPNATHTGDVTGATALTIANNAVNSAKIADGAVATADIANGAITPAKIAACAPNQILKYVDADGTGPQVGNWACSADLAGSGGDDWGSQAVKTDGVTLLGDGTVGTPLYANFTEPIWNADHLQGTLISTDFIPKDKQALVWRETTPGEGFSWRPGGMVSSLIRNNTNGRGFSVTVSNTVAGQSPAAGDLQISLNTPDGSPSSIPSATAGNVYLGWDGNSQWKAYTFPTTGTVSSVGLALPSNVFSISGSPVSTSGTLTGTFNTQQPNTVFAGPTSGSAAAPTFRALTANDIGEKGSLVAGAGVTLTPAAGSSLSNRLIGAGDVTIAASQNILGKQTYIPKWTGTDPSLDSSSVTLSSMREILNGNVDANDATPFDISDNDRVVIGTNLYVSGRTYFNKGVVLDSLALGDWPTVGGWSFFGNKNKNANPTDSQSNYALIQSPDGETFLNSSPNKDLHLRVGNQEKITVTNGGTALSGATYLTGGSFFYNGATLNSGQFSIPAEGYAFPGLKIGTNATPKDQVTADIHGTMTIDDIQLRDVNPTVSGLQTAKLSSLYTVCPQGYFVTGVYDGSTPIPTGSKLGQPICTKLQ